MLNEYNNYNYILNILYIFIVHGSFNDVTALDFMKVQLDLNYRKEWDSMCVDLDIFDSEPLTHSDLIYWELRWPVIIIIFLYYHDRSFYIFIY